MVSNVDMNNTFSFEPITADDISQQIKRLDKCDIPKKLVKHLDNLMIMKNFNNCLKKVSSLMTLKRLWFVQPIKRTTKRKGQTTDQLAFSLIYLKLLNGFYMTKCVLISVIFSLNINVAFKRDVVHNTNS